VVESFDDNNSIITHYDLQQNTYSDQAFSNDFIEKLGQQEENIKVLVDGAYYSEEIFKKAIENIMKFIPTNLVGRHASSEKSGYEAFNIDEIDHIVKNCPMGFAPSDSRFKNGVYKAHFPRELCDNCPHRPNCPVSEQKKQYLLEVSERMLHRAMLKAEMGTSEYQEIASKRAGVEGIPSTLRRQYDVDHLPVRGRMRSKFWLGFKIGAINCKRYIKSRIQAAKDSLSAVTINHLLEVLCFQRSYVTI
jgi:hypothetical protein